MLLHGDLARAADCAGTYDPGGVSKLDSAWLKRAPSRLLLGEKMRFRAQRHGSVSQILEVLPGLGAPKYPPVKAIAFHTSSTAKFYGDDYAVESP